MIERSERDVRNKEINLSLGQSIAFLHFNHICIYVWGAGKTVRMSLGQLSS